MSVRLSLSLSCASCEGDLALEGIVYTDADQNVTASVAPCQKCMRAAARDAVRLLGVDVYCALCHAPLIVGMADDCVHVHPCERCLSMARGRAALHGASESDEADLGLED